MNYPNWCLHYCSINKCFLFGTGSTKRNFIAMSGNVPTKYMNSNKKQKEQDIKMWKIIKDLGK